MKSTTDKLAGITDDLSGDVLKLEKLHVDYAIECEHAEMDNEEHPELSEKEMQKLESIALGLERCAKNIKALRKEIADWKQQYAA